MPDREHQSTGLDAAARELWRLTKNDSTLAGLLALPDAEKLRRFDDMVRRTFSHVDGRDLLRELHPRNTLDIKRRVDGVEKWFEGDWLSALTDARDGRRWQEWRG